MKTYACILIFCAFTMHANGSLPFNISNSNAEAPPITTSPAYVPQKCPEEKAPSTRWKMTTILAATVAGIALGLTMTGKDKGKSAPAHK